MAKTLWRFGIFESNKVKAHVVQMQFRAKQHIIAFLSEQPKLYGVLAVLSAVGLNEYTVVSL